MLEHLPIAKSPTADLGVRPAASCAHPGQHRQDKRSGRGENFSRIGVPVFLADVKGDSQDRRRRRCRPADRANGLASSRRRSASPVMFWMCSEKADFQFAHRLDMGPLLLSRLLVLTTQRGVLADLQLPRWQLLRST